MLAITTEGLLWLVFAGAFGLAALVVGGSLLGQHGKATVQPDWLRVLLAIGALLLGLAALAFAFVLGMCAFGSGAMH